MKTSLARIIVLALIGIFLTLHAHAEISKTTLTTADGEKFIAYTGGPSNAKTGIVVVHDWFGDSQFFRQSAERLAKLGYRVIAVDYYNGQSATTHEGAGKLLGSLDRESALQKVDAAFNILAKKQKQLASLSFSAGTDIAHQAGAKRSDIAAQALWYGYMPGRNKENGTIADTLVVVGSKDGDAPKNAEKYLTFMNQNNHHGELYVYPLAHHAFAQPLFNEGRTYDESATSAAWVVTESFFKRTLK